MILRLRQLCCHPYLILVRARALRTDRRIYTLMCAEP
jgi:hypothetical protein